MGRKNGAARRRNIKGRMDRRQQGISRPRADTKQPRIELEDLVIPDRQCFFPRRKKPKAGFGTKAQAEKALRQAQRQRARTGAIHVEKRVYPCPTVPCPVHDAARAKGVQPEPHSCPPTGCGGWHLTSREEFDENAWKNRGTR